MRRTVLNGVLLGGLAMTLAMTGSMQRDPTEPNFAFMREMVDSIPYDAFAANPVLPGGRTQQAPVPGTVARGEVPLHYAATPEDALRAGEELVNPHAESLFWNGMDAQMLAKTDQGTATYRIYCVPCHGVSGQGDGLVAQRGFPPPPPLFAEKAANMADGQLFHVITYGQGNMPGYGVQIPPEDRWDLVLHIRSLQEAAAAAAEGVEP